MSDDLFPLPLTPFEYYYWCDDRPASPTTFPIELIFRGSLDRTAFIEALRFVKARHPLLNARVDVHSSRVPRWVAASETTTPVDWADTREPIRPSPVAFLDLTSSSGLRVWVRTSEDRTRVVLQFHHACCDALGALQFVEEMLMAYDAVVKGAAVDERLPPLDSAQLRLRGDYGLQAADYRLNLWDVFMTARIWAATLLRRPTLIASPRSDCAAHGAADQQRGYLTETISHEEMQRLHDAARRAGTTVNDLMLRDLFLVLQQWNAAHDGRRRQRLTVNVPVSLRGRSEKSMPAANSLGFWFVHRSTADCTHPDSLLDSIREEMAAVKKWRMPLYFIGGLGVATHVLGLMRGMLTWKRSFATAVFSNVGRVFARSPLDRRDGRLVCGNAVLETVTGVPPVRRGTRIAIVVATYANETSINLRSDPQFLAEADAAILLKQFREQLINSSGIQPAAVRQPLASKQ